MLVASHFTPESGHQTALEELFYMMKQAWMTVMPGHWQTTTRHRFLLPCSPLLRCRKPLQLTMRYSICDHNTTPVARPGLQP